jgi:hypothetical protein
MVRLQVTIFPVQFAGKLWQRRGTVELIALLLRIHPVLIGLEKIAELLHPLKTGFKRQGITGLRQHMSGAEKINKKNCAYFHRIQLYFLVSLRS